MQQEVNRVFSQPGISNLAPRGDDIASTVWVPAVELEYQNDKLVVSAELPGLDDEDITVEVRDDALVISGEREVEQEEDLSGVRRTERRYGQFYRAIPLPDGADPSQATATLEDGVLRIEIPVSQEGGETQRIPIQGSTSAQASGEAGRSSSQAGTQATSSPSGSSSSTSQQKSSAGETSSSGQKAA